MKYLKPALTAATLILIGGTTVGCGGAPTDASEGDFCDTYVSGVSKMLEAGDDKKKAAEALNDWGDELEDTGTPDGIGDDERDGFEVLVDAAKDADEDDVDGDVEDLVSGDDKDNVDKFGTYVEETCADEISDIVEVPTDVPTDDLPTDLPTDLSDVPTELPSDVPTELPSDLESQLSEIPTEVPSS